MMKKLIVAVIALTMTTTASSYAQGVPISAAVSVDTVEATPGGHAAVKVRLDNNTYELGAIEVPLKFGADLTLDSVSFVGSLLKDGFSSYLGYVDDAQTVRVIYLPEVVSPVPTLNDYSGTIVELFFSVSATAAPGIHPVDSINEMGLVPMQLLFSDGSGSINYLPQFVPGAVIVQSPTAVEDEGDLLPSEFMLAQNYPNPFNPTTAIQFALPTGSHVTLDVFNVLGRKVVRLADGYYSAGVHRVDFDASDQPTGIYFYRLTYEGGVETKKMVFLK
ncbi:MAG: T9SS type A sorting domain-containing protein [Candidatus Zixiibacteriota bacterium]|nr:MAG: T9SS type A sorting domain-containing protein [candidate division Zixibacteria bacterium]